jgi:hypothetical protein
LLIKSEGEGYEVMNPIQPTPVGEAMRWIVVTALYDPRFTDTKEKVRKVLYAEAHCRKHLATLELRGCNKEILLTTLAFAEESARIDPRTGEQIQLSLLQWLCPPLVAEDLRKLSQDVENLLTRMKTQAPSIALPMLQESDEEHEFIAWQMGGDYIVGPWLENELRDKATLYNELALACTRGEVPTKATIGRAAFLWPLAYVEASTEEPPPYALMAELLDSAGYEKHGDYLQKAFEEFKRKYPGILDWLVQALRVMEEVPTPGYGLSPDPFPPPASSRLTLKVGFHMVREDSTDQNGSEPG